MVRICCVIVIVQMAGHAFGWDPLILAIVMAFGTLNDFVLSFEGEGRVGEIGIVPGVGIGSMALFAIRGKVQSSVIWILSFVVVFEMTVYAIRRDTLVLSFRVTVCAESCLMLSFERKSCMREIGIVPGVGVRPMTQLTICGETQCPVIGVLCGIIVIQMTGHTFG